MSELSPKDGSNDLEITLTNGKKIKACIKDKHGDERRGPLICSDNCPFMCVEDWEPANCMDRNVLVWTCDLFGRHFPFLRDWDKCRYHSIRCPECLSKDPGLSKLSPNLIENNQRLYNGYEPFRVPLRLTSAHRLVEKIFPAKKR